MPISAVARRANADMISNVNVEIRNVLLCSHCYLMRLIQFYTIYLNIRLQFSLLLFKIRIPYFGGMH